MQGKQFFTPKWRKLKSDISETVIVSHSACLAILFKENHPSNRSEINVCPVWNQRRIIVFDSEEENDIADREINFTSDDWLWENNENESKIWRQYSQVPRMNIEMRERITALQRPNQILPKNFWNIVTESNH